MQTFLPNRSFAKSAQILDYRRLGKQRIECKQILQALSNPSHGYRNHPAVKMWAGYEQALISYAIEICKEWLSRGYVDNQLSFFQERQEFSTLLPPWLGKKKFHSSHRAALLFKDSKYYKQFGWSETPIIQYYWPKGKEK